LVFYWGSRLIASESNAGHEGRLTQWRPHFQNRRRFRPVAFLFPSSIRPNLNLFGFPTNTRSFHPVAAAIGCTDPRGPRWSAYAWPLLIFCKRTLTNGNIEGIHHVLDERQDG